ncbi:MAG: hypothetical protein E7254_11545 [Lachnospiraceae bacterium]|nr:hypothetical protein [Lachnospiraceae bacterium]
MFKHVVKALMIMALSVSLLSGCAKSEIGNISLEAGESGVYIHKDGVVEYEIYEDFGESYYDKKDLKKKVKDEIDSFNAGGASKSLDAAKLNYFGVKDKKVKVIIEFKSTSDFVNYLVECNEEENSTTFIGKISDAVSAGIPFKGEFAEISNSEATGEVAKGKEIREMDLNVIAIKEKMKVQLDSSVKYISQNCEVKDNIVDITDSEQTIIVYEEAK